MMVKTLSGLCGEDGAVAYWKFRDMGSSNTQQFPKYEKQLPPTSPVAKKLRT